MPDRASRFAAKIREALMNEPDWNTDKVEGLYTREREAQDKGVFKET